VADELRGLASLSKALGVQTAHLDGLGRTVEVAPDTLVRVCAALGADLEGPSGADAALRSHHARQAEELLPPVVVAWDGRFAPLTPQTEEALHAELRLEDGGIVEIEVVGTEVRVEHPLPWGYHHLTVEIGSRTAQCTVIAAPRRAWRRPEAYRSWGLGAHLSALRCERSRSVGDLRDLQALCGWVADHGGDLVTVMPLLPTFNHEPAEPSPYSPVSRLFWSELILDLGSEHVPTSAPDFLDVRRADAEVRAALAGIVGPEPDALDAELVRYARFRGAQARYGRNWREWPGRARDGILAPTDVASEEERFHLVAQTRVRAQLDEVSRRLQTDGVRLGLDLAVGTHADGYDTWSRRTLFAEGMSVGAPPDPGFPEGQDWGFAPVLPAASRQEGHRYLADSIAHQAALAGVLRVDHIMAVSRLYWIPHGGSLHEGAYVRYPDEELFAVLVLESHRNRCEIVGENLGTVPKEIRQALPRHDIRGMYLAEFMASAEEPTAPSDADVALVGTHDTPTLAGWLVGADIDERVRMGLLNADRAPDEHEARRAAAGRLSALLGVPLNEPKALLRALLGWLGRSDSPLVIPWIEDLWLEPEQVNLPGTRSSDRSNWQRPMGSTLDEIMADAEVRELLHHLNDERRAE
jgi:4-alpha-glucanotransferase